MLKSPVLIAILGLGILILLALIVAYLKSKGSSDRDRKRLLGDINSSLEDIMDRVDNLEAQRKAGGADARANPPNQAARRDVDDFLSQFNSDVQVTGQDQVASEFFGVQETEAGVSNDDFWSDFDRPMKKLDGHDRETQASLRPRSDRPMRLSRQTMQQMYSASAVESVQEQSAMPQPGAAPSHSPVQQQAFVQPVFASAGAGQPQIQRPVSAAPAAGSRAPQPSVQPAPRPAPQPQGPRIPATEPRVQTMFSPERQETVRQPVRTVQQTPVQPAPQRPQRTVQQPLIQPAPQRQQRTVQQPPVQPAPQRPQRTVQPPPVQPAPQRPQRTVQQPPVQPAPQRPQRTVQQPPVQPAPQAGARPEAVPSGVEIPAGSIKYTDRSSGTDKQGRSYSVDELMQQIR